MSGDRGPCSKYDISITEGNFKGELEMVWEGDPLKVHYNIFVYIFEQILMAKQVAI